MIGDGQGHADEVDEAYHDTSSHSFGTPWASLGYSQARTSCTAMFSCSRLHSTFGCSCLPHPPPGETPPPICSERTPFQLVGAPLRCPPHPYSIDICRLSWLHAYSGPK